MTASPSENFRPAPKGARSLVLGASVCAIATLTSHFTNQSYAASLVALVFLGASYFLCLRRGAIDSPAHFGLAFGGLFEDAPLEGKRIARATLRSIGFALVPVILIFPCFAFFFPLYYGAGSFSWTVALASLGKDTTLIDLALAQIFVVALPEEAFFRGYLQTRLDETPRKLFSRFGIDLTLGNVLSSALFALGHLATIPHPARLAVFFPSLVFGMLRTKSGSVAPGILFHAASNLLSTLLAAGYGLY